MAVAIDIVYRPIDTWPGELHTYRTPGRFDSTWTQTKELLEREVAQLNGYFARPTVVIQLAVPEGAIRQDGQLMKGRKAPDHPGVIVSFPTQSNGDMKFWCDEFGPKSWRPTLDGWQTNVRAIALGLEALRKVQRYGLNSGQEQYAGFQALGTGVPMGSIGSEMTRQEAAEYLSNMAVDAGLDTFEWTVYMGNSELVLDVYKQLVKIVHPDAGGSSEAFKKVTAAKDILA